MERQTDRTRIIIGNLDVEDDHRYYADGWGPTFMLELSMCQNTGEFDITERVDPHRTRVTRYRGHTFVACIWRWGVYLSVRAGRVNRDA